MCGVVGPCGGVVLQLNPLDGEQWEPPAALDARFQQASHPGSRLPALPVAATCLPEIPTAQVAATDSLKLVTDSARLRQ